MVVIDLQKGIVNKPLFPYDSKQVISHVVSLADVFRKNNMPVFFVRVTPSPDLKDALKPSTDIPAQVRNNDADYATIVPELGPKDGDFIITKRQWGAFYGTELDLELRRRGIEMIVLCGVSTNIGVESTARFAYEYGYQQIFVSDAMASAKSIEEHETTLKYIFPRIGRIRTTADILNELN